MLRIRTESVAGAHRYNILMWNTEDAARLVNVGDTLTLRFVRQGRLYDIVELPGGADDATWRVPPAVGGDLRDLPGDLDLFLMNVDWASVKWQLADSLPVLPITSLTWVGQLNNAAFTREGLQCCIYCDPQRKEVWMCCTQGTTRQTHWFGPIHVTGTTGNWWLE
jgi:hypothetical protein